MVLVYISDFQAQMMKTLCIERHSLIHKDMHRRGRQRVQPELTSARADLVDSKNIATDKGRFREKGGPGHRASALQQGFPLALTADLRRVTGAWWDHTRPNHGKGQARCRSSFSPRPHTQRDISASVITGQISQLTMSFHKNTWGPEVEFQTQ